MTRPRGEGVDAGHAGLLLLRDLIHDRAGLFYADDKRDMLVGRVAPRLAALGLASFLDYYYLLKYDAAGAAEWLRLMDALAVPETYFWREMDAVRALVDRLVPQWVAANPGLTLRIWSAACASGEEPLTVAMALQEAGWFERAAISIVASDASPAAVAAARAGLYGERSLRALPEPLRRRYFTPAARGWRIAPELHARVSWDVVNLRDEPAVRRYAGAPFILCRNVFIYFSLEHVAATARLLYQQMPRPGYLLLGTAESFVRTSVGFELQQIAGAFVYAKE